MISLRDPDGLHHLLLPVYYRHMRYMRDAGLIPVGVCFYRSPLEQDRLYKIGRRGVEGEKIVTKVRGGQSWHNVTRDGGPASLAYDIVLMTPEKKVCPDGHRDWERACRLGEELKLTCGHRWGWDSGHYQLDDLGELTLAQANAGQDPQEVA